MKPHRRKGVRVVYALVLLFLALLLYQARFRTVQLQWLTITLVQFSDVVVLLAEQWIGSSHLESEAPEFIIPTIYADIPKRDAVVKAFRVRQNSVIQSDTHDWVWLACMGCLR